MFSEESLETRQRNEFEALNAIYGNDLKDLRKTTKRRWVPLNFSITLTPLQGSTGLQEVHVKVDLHVVCTAKYPDSVPKLFLENSQGVSNALLMQLHDELEKKAHSMKGQEMIFELAQHVQEFLHRHNKPGIKSFYEEMLNRQKEEAKKHKQAEQLEKDRKRQIMLEEIQKRQEMLKTEMKLMKASRFDEVEGRTRRHSSGSLIENSEENCCNHKCGVIVKFSNNGYREIQRGSCISHLARDCTIYSGIDKESGELLAVIEWIVILDSENDFSQAKRQLLNLEQEFNYLVKLKHKNLLHYLNIKYEFFDVDKKITVQILQEFLFGCNCKSFLLNQSVDLELLKHVIRGVLSALDYLHRNNVVHKKVKSACVFLDNDGVVKVSNYSVDKKLSDLFVQKQVASNYSKKTDIYKLGLLILSLIHGNCITREIPKSLPSDLHNFLENCLATDEKKRFTALQLLNHTFLKSKIYEISPKIETINCDEPERNISPEIPIVEMKMINSSQNEQSRVKNEFEFLQHIGTGAYGDVIKVRNNLDGCYYAIKRIELNPKNKQLKKRIIREVKLLSRLNHENVVRYYNSWIETALIENEEGTRSSQSTSIDNGQKESLRTQLNIKDDVEALAPPIKNVVEWPISADTKSISTASTSSTSDEEDIWMINLDDSSSSDSIQFEHNTNNIQDEDGSNTLSNNSMPSKSTHTPSSPLQNLKQVQFMYIQMEFCEKSTLRTAIDKGLYCEEDRLWRLFREIVEGLAHIHQQGMIHRDLKPVNIFLDVNDHVKIGDFGLATTSMRMRYGDTYNSTNKSLVESDIAGSLTGHVGTALYVAPELNSNTKAVYNQKVDIYSLGIILFEMCYRPLNTGMERIKILSGLRSKEIVFPQDFKKPENEKKEILIHWLLEHDISKRPTSQEVLQSELIPPPVLEERELRELLRHTLSNPQLKAYKYLVASCFKQSFTPAQDITYDRDPLIANLKPLLIHELVRDATVKIFKLHGGQNLATPLLMPKSKYYENVDTCVKLMTHSGNIVSIPHDLRVPFARYIAWNGITLLRRYSIERVYREKKVFGFLPREFYECAFDIVTPNKGNLIYDAEVLYIVEEIINDLPYLKNKHFLIRLNHTALIKGILYHCGIKEKHTEVYNILQQVREGKLAKMQLQMYLAGFGLSDSTIATLVNLIYSEFEINKAVSVMQAITKRKSGEASQLAKQALQELKIVMQNAEALGVTFDVVINPGLVYNIQQYSGVIFQFVCELKKKHKQDNMEVLAAGGRYDSMISEYRNIMEQANMLSKDFHQQSAVGVSISLDKLAQAVQEGFGANFEFLDVVVCSLGNKSSVKEKARVLKNLWTAGIRACLIEANNMEEIQEQCNELKVPHVIMLKDSEQGTVRVRSWERDRFQEKTFNVTELTENMQRILKSWNENGHYEQLLIKSESRSSYIVERQQEHGHDANVNVIFVTNEKLSANARRRYDNQIRSQLDVVFKRINGDIIILGLTIECGVIKTIAAYITFDSEHSFQQSLATIIDKHQRHKKYLLEICDEIYEQKMKRTNPILILYSLSDSFYKLLL